MNQSINPIQNPKIRELAKIFGSRSKAQEIILLLSGAKPVVRQGFYMSELALVADFCNKNGIHLVRSKFFITVNDTESGYSNSGVLHPQEYTSKSVNNATNNNNTIDNKMFFVYFSLNRENAIKAATYEEQQNHESLGQILGYPECCIKFFCNKFSDTNPNLERPSNNLFTNLSHRDKDYVILSHFPCNSECKNSILLAQKYLKTIHSYDPHYALELLSELDTSKNNSKSLK